MENEMEKKKAFYIYLFFGLILFILFVLFMESSVKAETMQRQETLTQFFYDNNIVVNIPSGLQNANNIVISKIIGNYRIAYSNDFGYDIKVDGTSGIIKTVNNPTNTIVWSALITDNNSDGVYDAISAFGNYTSMFAYTSLGNNLVWSNHDIYVGSNLYYQSYRNVTYPGAYVLDGYNVTYPYYVVYDTGYSLTFAATAEPWFIDNDGLIRHDFYYMFYTSVDGGQTWSERGYQNAKVTRFLGHYDGTNYTELDYTNIVYNNDDIYRTNISAVEDTAGLAKYSTLKGLKTSEIVVPKNPMQIDVKTYVYEYKSDVENVNGLTIEKDALWRSGWGWNIGVSKTKYVVKWVKPEVLGYRLEVQIQSKFNGKTRRYDKQTYKKPWTDTVRITPEQESFKIDIQSLGGELLEKCWYDVDTGGYFNIPPTQMYFRYVSLDSDAGKAYYGNWTRCDFSGGSQGIIETKKDTAVTTNETYNPETDEYEYQDIEMDGNETEYINSSGEVIPESQSFNAAVSTLDNAMSSSIGAIQGFGNWVGSIPDLFSAMFKFLPPECTALIGLGIAVLIILRIGGR